METYYSIIKIAPNPSAGDSLSIGLLLYSHKRFYIHFSENKKKTAKHLLYQNSEVVDYVVKQIEQKVKDLNGDLDFNKDAIFTVPSVINSDYFKYLHKYSNGILQFSKPGLINDDVTEEKFLRLFEILVDKLPVQEHKTSEAKEQKFINTVERKLIKRVHNVVHTNVKIDSKSIPELYYQFDIDCIGLNGSFVGAKSLQFSKSYQTIDKEISHYTNLITVLSINNKKEFSKNHFYLIADEPAVINSREHEIWDIIQKQPLFLVIHPEESDKVAEIIEKTKAHKFLEV